MSELRSDALLEAGSVALRILRFADGAAHPSHSATPADSPRLGEEAYIFAPSRRLVPLADVPAFLASLTSPAVLIPSTTRGIVSLMLLDELAGERAAMVRQQFENSVAGLDYFADELHLAADSGILLEYEDEAHVFSFAVLRLSLERFAVDVGWSLSSLADDVRASARLNLIRSDGVDTANRPERRDAVAITADVPFVYHTDGDMVLAALGRHVPALVDMPSDVSRVYAWLMLDDNGRVERTAVSTEQRPPGRRTMAQVLLEPFADEKMRRFESAGSAMIPAGFAGPNRLTVWWLQRRADVAPDPDRGIYQFDSLRMLPARSVRDQAVKERHPAYAQVGLADGDIPWLIVDAEGNVVDSWLGPYVQHSLLARQMLQEKYPEHHFTSVRIGNIETAEGARPPIVWATI